MTKLASSTDWSRRRLIAYWVITVLIATECLVGGMMGALRLPPFIGIMKHLGYPAYFMTIIGVWYMLAGVSLLAPRFPRLKEWAYAGLVFNYTGAAASHLAVGIPPSRWWPRSSSPPSWSLPGPCVHRLAAPREPVREATPVKLNQQRYAYEYISSSH
jgi:hypothetical protein